VGAGRRFEEDFVVVDSGEPTGLEGAGMVEEEEIYRALVLGRGITWASADSARLCWG
jgi:hypothetical protein